MFASVLLPVPALSLLMKALLRGVEMGGALPWDELRSGVFPAGVSEDVALAYASGLQRVVARATTEMWAPSAVSAHLIDFGMPADAAEAAASAWAAGSGAVYEAVSRRADARSLLSEPPRFVAINTSATSHGEPGEARAIINFGAGDFEATKADLGAALASIAQLKKALGAA